MCGAESESESADNSGARDGGRLCSGSDTCNEERGVALRGRFRRSTVNARGGATPPVVDDILGGCEGRGAAGVLGG